MNQNQSFWQEAIPYFLVGVLFAAGYFVYRNNPFIMSQEYYFHKLTQNTESPELRIQLGAKSETAANSNEDGAKTESKYWQSHRFSHKLSAAPENEFRTIQLKPGQPTLQVADDFLLIKQPDQLSVYKRSGEFVWSFAAPSGFHFLDGPIAQNQKTWYVATAQGRIYAFEIPSGRMVWYLEKERKYIHDVMVRGQQVITFFESVPGQSWGLEALAAIDGTTQHSVRKLEYPLAGDPLISSGVLYFATQTGQLRAISLGDFKTLWSAEGSSGFYSGPALFGNKILLTNEDGYLIAFESKTGKRTNEIELDTIIHQPLQVHEQLPYAYAVDISGYLVAADLRTSKRAWRYNLNQSGSVHPTKLVRLTAQSFNQMSVSSPPGGWTVWAPCQNTRICLFDAKDGKLLHRLDLKARLVQDFSLAADPESGYFPVSGGEGTAKIISLSVPQKSGPSSVIQ